MATLPATGTLTDHRAAGLTDTDALGMFTLMLCARTIDERMWLLNRQGAAPFTVPCRGQEGAQAGIALALDPTTDWLFPHYRDTALVQRFGFTPEEIFLMFFAKAGDVVSGGRQLTHHWGSQARHIGSLGSPLASQVPHAAGAAYALRLQGNTAAVVATTFGEGGASKGDFYEGCSLAAIHRLPVVFICENNEYAISTPMHTQSPVPDVASRAAAFGFPGVVVDGTDPFAVYAAVREAHHRARTGGGPTLIEAKMYRLLPHTSDDNDRLYRSREEVADAETRDPLRRITAYMQEHALLDGQEIDDRTAAMQAEVSAAAAAAMAAPDPNPTTLLDHVYAEDAR